MLILSHINSNVEHSNSTSDLLAAVGCPTHSLPCILTRDKTSERYHSNYQLDKELWLEPFYNRLSDWSNILIHSAELSIKQI